MFGVPCIVLAVVVFVVGYMVGCKTLVEESEGVAEAAGGALEEKWQSDRLAQRKLGVFAWAPDVSPHMEIEVDSSRCTSRGNCPS